MPFEFEISYGVIQKEIRLHVGTDTFEVMRGAQPSAPKEEAPFAISSTWSLHS